MRTVKPIHDEEDFAKFKCCCFEELLDYYELYMKPIGYKSEGVLMHVNIDERIHFDYHQFKNTNSPRIQTRIDY